MRSSACFTYSWVISLGIVKFLPSDIERNAEIKILNNILVLNFTYLASSYGRF